MIYIEQITHPTLNVEGGACIYFKNFLLLKVIDIQYLQECINFKMKIGRKNYITSLFYTVQRANLKMTLKHF